MGMVFVEALDLLSDHKSSDGVPVPYIDDKRRSGDLTHASKDGRKGGIHDEDGHGKTPLNGPHSRPHPQKIRRDGISKEMKRLGPIVPSEHRLQVLEPKRPIRQVFGSNPMILNSQGDHIDMEVLAELGQKILRRARSNSLISKS